MSRIDELFEFRGTKVTADWPNKIEQAQKLTTYTLNGSIYSRIRYGQEYKNYGASAGSCSDCAVIKGEYHVPGCDQERCPRCGSQAFGCDCADSDELCLIT